MPTPSLLIVPARFKSGKLYSQIPTSGAGDFTVTRATAATRVNASGFIESVASGIPRLDYFASDGTVGCPALLVEPSGSNLALRSAEFEVSGTWAPTNTSVTTGTTAAFTAPDNSTDADLLTSTTSGSSFVGQTIAIASGTYTISVFGKAGTSHIFSLGNVSRNLRGAWFNLNAGAVTGTVNGGTASMQNYGNGWYRCIYTSSGMVSGTNTLIVGLADAANGLSATSGTNLYVWGAQLETGSVATSYIPTTTAAVTRNADVVSVSGAVSGSIGQTEGTIYLDLTVLGKGSSSATRWVQIFGPSNNIGLAINSSNLFRSIVNTQSDTLLTAPLISSGVKVAWAYDATGTTCFINGTQYTLTTGGNQTMSSLTSISIDGSANTAFGFARIRAAALYNTRLTNAELAALTSP